MMMEEEPNGKAMKLVSPHLRYIMSGIFALCCPSSAANAIDTAPYLAQWLQQPTIQIGETLVESQGLRNFYGAEGYRPIWTDAQGLTPRATQALNVIANAGVDGLNPEIYKLSSIRALTALPASDTDTILRNHLSLEILISDAIMHYASDMDSGFAHHQWNTGKESTTADEQLALLQQAAANPNIAEFLTALAPKTQDYTALKKVLQEYQTIASKGGWPEFVPGKTIKPGAKDPRVATLRQILFANGDLAANIPAQENTYDALTMEAVKHFQERHGLDANGIINTPTQEALTVPVADRITQISMTLDRMRWMPKDIGSRYVMVNIPAYALTAISGNNRLNMNVIVGKASTKTPMFSKNITDIVFNPSWGVPTKIAVNEMLPKVRKDPDYLIKAGYTVMETRDGNSHVIDPHEVNWQSIGRGNFTYSFRQNPGDGNALGKVKFNIPDSDDIYLHDTSQHRLFERADRSLSHGCIRLSEPKSLTEFILGNEGWPEPKIEAAYDSATSKTVHITPLPVHLVYWTSWVDSQGRAHFSRDIYGMDKTLLAASKPNSAVTKNVTGDSKKAAALSTSRNNS